MYHLDHSIQCTKVSICILVYHNLAKKCISFQAIMEPTTSEPEETTEMGEF